MEAILQIEIPCHQEQLKFITLLSENRIEALAPFFRFLNYWDTPYFFFVLLPIVWIGFSWIWGIRLTYLAIFNSFLNMALKHLIGWPRPSTDLPGLGMLDFTSPGFPSGGAQTSILFGGLLIYYSDRRWAQIVGIGYILLISFSRLYLGAHYPIDVLGGWAIGYILLLLFIRWIDPIEKFLSSRPLEFNLILSEIIPLSILFATFEKSSQTYALIALGFGIYFSLKYNLYLKKPKDLQEGCKRALFGSLGLILLNFYCPIYPILALWISLFASPLWMFIRKRI